MGSADGVGVMNCKKTIEPAIKIGKR